MLTKIMHQRFVHQPDIECRVQGLEDQEVKDLTRISCHVEKGDHSQLTKYRIHGLSLCPCHEMVVNRKKRLDVLFVLSEVHKTLHIGYS